MNDQRHMDSAELYALAIEAGGQLLGPQQRLWRSAAAATCRGCWRGTPDRILYVRRRTVCLPTGGSLLPELGGFHEPSYFAQGLQHVGAFSHGRQLLVNHGRA